MRPRASISGIVMEHNSTFGASNAANPLELNELAAICQIDSSTLSAMVTARLSTAVSERRMKRVKRGQAHHDIRIEPHRNPANDEQT